jgi:hypothetical protein
LQGKIGEFGGVEVSYARFDVVAGIEEGEGVGCAAVMEGVNVRGGEDVGDCG